MKLRSALLVAMSVSAVVAVPSPSAYAAGGTYCCVGANGRRVCGDMLPQECYGRPYREVDSGGNLLRQVDAPLTAEQIAQRRAEAARKKEEERAAMEQKRKDQALLNAYTSEQDIEFMRNRALADADAGSAEVQQKLKDALKRKQTFADELEFYKKKSAPLALTEQIKANESEIKAQQAAVDAKAKEREKVNQRFDEEKKRYLELSHGPQSVTTTGVSPPP